jgi:pimeloyl-ACP methyl ester carboxylesterase
MHYLCAGSADDPVLLLLHGFPELAYSWRKVMPALAAAGYRVIAPDQRGYGRTTGWPDGYDVDLLPYQMPALVLDQLALLAALEIPQVHGVIGHDFGSPVAAWSALIRPDVFPRLVTMSAPFAGPPGFPRGERIDIDQALAGLSPPRRHYQWYYGLPAANEEMLHAPQGVRDFLAQYYYLKSGCWSGNEPQPLESWTAESLSVMPGYYVMPREMTMAETVAADSEDEDLSTLASWLEDAELDVYAAEFSRTGFQGGLNWYRAALSPEGARALRLYSGSRIQVPATFISGSRDWGMYQTPGALEAMAERGCADFRGCQIVADAGHWVQQEAPDEVARLILEAMAG